MTEKTSLDDLKIDRSGVDDSGSRSWTWIFLFIPVAAIGGLAFSLMKPPGKVVVVSVARETSLDGAQTVLNASGYVTARTKATVSSKVTARVLEVLIEEGMRVEKGQVVARLDASNVETSVNLAEAELRSAKTARHETGANLTEVKLRRDRTKALVAADVVSQAELDSVQAELDSLEARLARQLEDESVAESRLAVWNQQLEDTIIRAPFSGIVTTKDAQPGEMISPVSAGGGFTRTGIGTVVDMDSLEIEVDVNESYINRVHAGQGVEAALDAYPDWKIPCHVIAIVPTADRDRATVRVRIGFEELDPRILPDMGVKVAFREDQTEQVGQRAVVIPREAVRRDDGADVVFVVNRDRVERRAVRLNPGEGPGEDEALVMAGIEGGERVVVQGPSDLADGDKVEVTSP
ncbi:MAG: efflux RND transporter periplasmic adaptor subunit [Acidobacteriota bacterium]|nr:MAG: efflux RND transporter periplasmic adaptor subunit [Acidobacteriota bacterium]